MAEESRKRTRLDAPELDALSVLLAESRAAGYDGPFVEQQRLVGGATAASVRVVQQQGSERWVLKSDRLDHAAKERDAMLRARGVPGFIRLLAWFEGDTARQRGLAPDEGHLLMELFGGRSLQALAAARVPLTLRQMQSILRQVFTALRDGGVYHGDLHTGNVLYSIDLDEVRLIDFGTSESGNAGTTALDIGKLHSDMKKVYALVSDLDKPENAEAKKQFAALRRQMSKGVTTAGGYLEHAFFSTTPL